ncbi:unnamed protein product [Symbiodinium pilosum]|uniref:Uncharacterized protein n=1 Tax=Symbiodinium pilosum TaxID=2952 RepID=A0A812X0C2_SYMPI|nr:unnamed protein product [Symbiodinium pilosum]
MWNDVERILEKIDGAERKAILLEAEKRANEELAFFRDKGDRRGEEHPNWEKVARVLWQDALEVV